MPDGWKESGEGMRFRTDMKSLADSLGHDWAIAANDPTIISILQGSGHASNRSSVNLRQVDNSTVNIHYFDASKRAGEHRSNEMEVPVADVRGKLEEFFARNITGASERVA